MRRRCVLLHVAVAVAIATGCSAPGSNNPPPATTNGEELFELKALGRSPGCVTCHSLAPDQVLVGPSLAGVFERAGGRVEGMSADQYVRSSITAPGEYVVANFDPEKMPRDYGELLTDEQIDALVDYLREVT